MSLDVSTTNISYHLVTRDKNAKRTCYEFVLLYSGIQGDEEISAFQIMFQVEGFAWMIPLGLGGACTARLGQYLGAKEPLGAITACRVSLFIQSKPLGAETLK